MLPSVQSIKDVYQMVLVLKNWEGKLTLTLEVDRFKIQIIPFLIMFELFIKMIHFHKEN